MKKCLFLLITMLNISLLAQDLQWRVFTTSNSTVPGNYFYCLGLDKDQNIWLAAHGLAKWDKQNPATFFQYPDLGSDIVRVTGDSTGYVWLSLEAPWVIRTNGDNWDTFQFTGNMWTTNIDIHNNFWGGAGHYSILEGLHKFDGNNWTVYNTTNSGLPSQIVLKITSDKYGKIWGLSCSNISSEIQLFSFNGTSWEIFPTEYPPFWISTIKADKKGNIWYATNYPEEGIVQFHGDDFVFHPSPDSTLYWPTTISTDTLDNLWVCWENGLAEYNNGNWSVYKDSIEYDFSDMAIDKENNIWLSTYSDGLVLFNKNGIVLLNDDTNSEVIPNDFSLLQNYPNPFNPTTQINYELPVSGLVTIKIFDILGKEISTLVNEEKQAGKYQVDFSSAGLSSGIYFYTLTSHNYSKTKKMVLLR